MIDFEDGDLDLDSLMERIRDEVNRRKATAGSQSEPPPSSSGSSRQAAIAGLAFSLPRLPEGAGRIERKPGYSLREFLDYHDEEFVRNAYIGLLQREPDAEGFGSFLEALRRGRLAKAEILGRMRLSAEGRACRVRVRGLGLAFAFRTLLRLPVLGRLAGIGYYLLRLPDLARHYERFEAGYFQRHVESIRRLNAGIGEIESGLRGLSAALIQVDEASRRSMDLLRSQTATAAEAFALKGAVAELSRLKADSDDLVRVIGTIAGLAEREHVAGVERLIQGMQQQLMSADSRLIALAAEAARRIEIEPRFTSIERALEFKVDGERLTHLTNQMLEQLKRRPERRDLDQLALTLDARAEEIGRAVEAVGLQKAGRDQLDALSTELAVANGVLSKSVADLMKDKADRSEVEAFAGQVAEVAAMRAILDRVGKDIVDLHRQQVEIAPAVAALRRSLETIVDEARYQSHDEGYGPNSAHKLLGERRFDAFYAAFENRFRGDYADIRARVSVYTPVVQRAGAGSPDAPVLDIGCGRGEWLELLRDKGMQAKGVDLNRVTVDECRARGLSVIESDGVKYLETLPANSVGAVTAIHVIEHLSFSRIVALLDETFRVLRPGGVAIFETPNPENLLVGACSFYSDPTHLRPLPPESTRFVVEARGYVEVSIQRLHEAPQQNWVSDGAPEVRTLLNRLLYGAQDYAVIGYKPRQ